MDRREDRGRFDRRDDRERFDRDRERMDRERTDRDRERGDRHLDGDLSRAVDRERDRTRTMERTVDRVAQDGRPPIAPPGFRRGGLGGPPPRPHANFKGGRGGFGGRRPAPDLPPRREIDRTKTCPFLLRVFPSVGKHHETGKYQKERLPYTPGVSQLVRRIDSHRKDADMRQIADLVKQVFKQADHHDSELRFAFVYTDPRGEVQMKEVGSVHSVTHNNDDKRTLADFRFMIGDYLDIAVVSGTK